MITDTAKNRRAKSTPTRYRPNKSTPLLGNVKTPQQTKQNKPLAYNPQRSTKNSNYGPTQARQKNNTRKPHFRKNEYKQAGYRNPKFSATTKKPVKEWVLTPGHDSRLQAFFAWARTLPNLAALKKPYNPFVFGGYRRRSAVKQHLISVGGRTVRSLLRPLSKVPGKRKQRCLLWKTPSFMLTATQARTWLSSDKKLVQVRYQPRRETALLKNFTSMLKSYVDRAGRKDTALWKEKQGARLAAWYADHYHPFRQRAWLDKTLFYHTQRLKRSLGDSQRLAVILLLKIRRQVLTRTTIALKSNAPKFLSRIAKVRQQLYRWCNRPQARDRKKKLRKILAPLMRPRTRKAATAEDKVSTLLWLFLTPQIRLKAALPLRYLRPVALNKKKNLWRKPAPLLHKECVRKQAYAAVIHKVRDICNTKNSRRQDFFDVEHAYELEKLKLRLRQPRAGHREQPVTRKKVWRRRIRRRKIGRKHTRRMRHKFRRRLRRFRRRIQAIRTVRPLQEFTVLRTKTKTPTRPGLEMLTVKKPTTPVRLNRTLQAPTTLLAVKPMTTNFSRFYSTKIHMPGSTPSDDDLPRERRRPRRKTKNTLEGTTKRSRLTRIKTSARTSVAKRQVFFAVRLLRKPAIALVPAALKSEGRSQTSPYALRSRRSRQKLKRLLPIKQNPLQALQRKPLFRRFIATRMIFVDPAKPRLTTVRSADKTQLSASPLRSGRIFDKNRTGLYRKGASRPTTTNYLRSESARSRAKDVLMQANFDYNRARFTQHWHALSRSARSKKRAWRLILKLRPTRRLPKRARKSPRIGICRLTRPRSAKVKFTRAGGLRYKSHRSVKVKFVGAPRKYRAAKAIRQRKLTRRKKLLARRAKRFKRPVVSKRRRTKQPVSILAEIQYRARRVIVGALHGASLKSRRRFRKRFFRIKKLKRKVNSRRRRWFQSAVRQFRRRRRPAGRKPWHSRLRRRIGRLWARVAVKKAQLRASRKLLTVAKLRRPSVATRRNMTTRRTKQRAADSLLQRVKVPVSLKGKALRMPPARPLQKDRQVRVERSLQQRAVVKGVLGSTPYFAVAYRLKSRLRTRRGRKGLTRKDQTEWKKVNRQQLTKALALQRGRQSRSVVKNKLKPLKVPAPVTKAERKRRKIHGIRRNRGRARLRRTRRIGFPSAVGVTRRRRVFTLSASSCKLGLLHKTASQISKKLSTLSKHRSLVQRVRGARIKFPQQGNKQTTRDAQPTAFVMTKSRETVKLKVHRTPAVKVANLSTPRPRFPAAGRTKDTFDSVLKTEYTRLAPLALKTRSTKRTSPAAAAVKTLQIRHPHAVETQRTLRRSALEAKRITAQAFLSRVQRSSVFCKTTHEGKFTLAQTFSKAQKKAQRVVRYQKPLPQGVYLGTASILLQQALRSRRLTRRARKLKLLGRKNSRGYTVKARPFWLKWRHAKKQRRAHSADRYAAPGAARFSRPVVNKWTINELATGYTRQRARNAETHTIQGESLRVSPAVRRIYKLEYKLRELRNKKRRLQALAVLRRKRKSIRLKKKGVHRASRRLREVFSRFWRHKKRKLRPLGLWSIRKGYRLERRNKRKLKRHWGYRKSLRQAILNATRNLLVRTAEEKEKLERLQAAERFSCPLTPLHFKKPSHYTTASAEENKKWQQHIGAVRKQKYRRLAEAADSLTTLMPRLISLLLERNKIKLTQEQCARAITTIYWNLRLLLLQARRNNAAKYAEESREKLHILKKEVTTNAASRFFTTEDVKNTRYRFQPYTITRAPSLQRGADDWLDQFLPQYYDLLLEAPEKYGHFRMTPIQVFRAQPSVAAVRTWETKPNPSTMESQFKRLTNGSYGRSSSRFETMLMTNRRHPLVNGYGASAEAQVLSPAGSTTKKTSFFKRHFSSTSHPAAVSARLLTRVRNTNSVEEQTPAPALLRPYKSLKERAVAKAQLNHVSEFNLESAGAVDPRLLRRKSPRSGEFLERGHAGTAVTQEGAVVKYRVYLEQQRGRGHCVVRNSRQTARVKDQSGDGATKRIRADGRARREASFLTTYKHLVEKHHAPTKQRRVGAGPYGFGYTRTTLQNADRKVLVNDLSLTAKNVLARKNLHRDVRTSTFGATPVIPADVFQVKRQLRNQSRRGGFGSRTKKKIWSGGKQLHTCLGNYYLKARPISRRGKMKLSFLQLRASSKKAKLPTRLFTTTPRYRRVSKIATKGFTVTAAVTTKKNIHKNFVKGFAEIRKTTKKINVHIKKQLARRRASLWAARRQELWHQLTHKWMKKRRILRRWLKGVKRSFKEKTHWTFEGEHALPEELFKLSRIRLRKLTWKKSDGRFEYPRLKQQLTLRPSERRTIPWMEGLLYSRALYSTQRMAIRRHQLPKDMKSKKWLQKAKKQLFKKATTHLYIRKKQWPRLRMYNQRLQRSLFKVRNTKVAVKRFQKLARHTAKNKNGAAAFAKGHLNRLDVNLLLLNFAPTTFWARAMTVTGLLQVNGKPSIHPDARLSPGDVLSWDHSALALFREYFRAPLKRWELRKEQELAATERAFPDNFKYNSQLGYATYLRHPTLDDLKSSSRINALLFKWFRLDSRGGK